MEFKKPSSKNCKLAKLLPRASTYTFPRLPQCHPRTIFGVRKRVTLVPAEARRRGPRGGGVVITAADEEPASPKVSCIGRIKMKKPATCSHGDGGLERRPACVLRRLFGPKAGVVCEEREEAVAGGDPPVPEHNPSLDGFDFERRIHAPEAAVGLNGERMAAVDFDRRIHAPELKPSLAGLRQFSSRSGALAGFDFDWRVCGPEAVEEEKREEVVAGGGRPEQSLGGLQRCPGGRGVLAGIDWGVHASDVVDPCAVKMAQIELNES